MTGDAALPSIVTAQTEGSDIVEPHGTGAALPCIAQALTDAVIGLLESPQECDRLRGNALREGRRLNWRSVLAREAERIGARLKAAR